MGRVRESSQGGHSDVRAKAFIVAFVSPSWQNLSLPGAQQVPTYWIFLNERMREGGVSQAEEMAQAKAPRREALSVSRDPILPATQPCLLQGLSCLVGNWEHVACPLCPGCPIPTTQEKACSAPSG